MHPPCTFVLPPPPFPCLSSDRLNPPFPSRPQRIAADELGLSDAELEGRLQQLGALLPGLEARLAKVGSAMEYPLQRCKGWMPAGTPGSGGTEEGGPTERFGRGVCRGVG